MREDVGDVVLVPTMTVRGRVMESNGAAVADALVWAIGNAQSAAYHWGQPGSTDTAGAYELRVGPGCYDMLAHHDGRATYKAEHVCGAPGDTVDAAPIVLDPCRLSLKGVVRHGDQPVGNARVRLGGLIDITDTEGAFSFACAPVETLRVDGYTVEPGIDLDGKTGDLALDVHVVDPRWTGQIRPVAPGQVRVHRGRSGVQVAL